MQDGSREGWIFEDGDKGIITADEFIPTRFELRRERERTTSIISIALLRCHFGLQLLNQCLLLAILQLQLVYLIS